MPKVYERELKQLVRAGRREAEWFYCAYDAENFAECLITQSCLRFIGDRLWHLGLKHGFRWELLYPDAFSEMCTAYYTMLPVEDFPSDDLLREAA